MGTHRKKKKATAAKSSAGSSKKQLSKKWLVLISVVLTGTAGLLIYQFIPLITVLSNSSM